MTHSINSKGNLLSFIHTRFPNYDGLSKILSSGSILLQHVDKLPSHIISAILQIDQKVDEDWPLTLVDHEG